MRSFFWLIGILLLTGLTIGCGGKQEKADDDAPGKDKSASKVAANSKETTTKKKKEEEEAAENNPPVANRTPSPGTTDNKNADNKNADNKNADNKNADNKNADSKSAVSPSSPDNAKTPAVTPGPNPLKALFGARTAARRMTLSNNLKQIGLAMHIHHDIHNTLPDVAIRDKDGKPLLSWRVKLLPFLDASSLYDQFKLDEAWDSPHNKALIAKMPRVFESPIAPTNNGTTRLMVVTGKGRLFSGEKPARFRDIIDGSSQTIMVISAGSDKAVPWTQPTDLQWQDGPPTKTVGKIGPEGIMCVLADGAVYTLPADLPEEPWKLLVDHRDGKSVDLDSLTR